MERSSRGRNWRRPTGRMMAKTARRVADRAEKKEDGRWQLVANTVSLGGNATSPRMISIEYRMDAALPCSLYAINLSAAVTLSQVGSPNQEVYNNPTLGVLAITKLRQGEAILTTAGKELIANPASTQNIVENQRAWRAWLPFQLLASPTQADSDWRMSPVRLPLRGTHHLLRGERLAIILAMPAGQTQAGRTIVLTIWGRFRYLVDSQYPSLSGPECGKISEDTQLEPALP